MKIDEAWVFDAAPPRDGWYAVLRCWDENEGGFPAAARREGGEWFMHTAHIIGWAGPFDSEQAAADYATANDPDL